MYAVSEQSKIIRRTSEPVDTPQEANRILDVLVEETGVTGGDVEGHCPLSAG
jgi:hypothetical protein